MAMTSKYRPDFVQRAGDMARFGATEPEIAKQLGASKCSLLRWRHLHPELDQAIRAGREVFDTATAEQCLLKRVTGYNIVETTEERDEDTGKMVVTKKVHKHMPPDVGAQIFWLCNRNPGRWRNRQQFEHSGPEGTGIQIKINLKLTKEDTALVQKQAQQAIAEASQAQ